MSSKTFLTISKKECLEVYLEIIANSESKWKTGKQLAENGEYGGATSLAIISVEELIKGLVVFLDGKGFDFRNVKGMDSIFHHHQIRYFLAYVMFTAGIFGDDLIKYIIKARENPNIIVKLVEDMKENGDFFEKNLKYYILRKMVRMRNELDWFSKVDVFRQDGFYCDYEEQLKNPINIKHDDYISILKRLEKVRQVGIAVIDGYNSEDKATVEHLAILKKEFKQNDHYQKIGDSLAKMRRTKQNPFDIIKQSLDEDKFLT